MIDKNTMFVWDGICESDDGGDMGYSVTWHGTVICTDNAPKGKDVPETKRNAFANFVASDLNFRVTGTAHPTDGNPRDGNKFKNMLIMFTGGDGWSYGGKWNKDSVHDVHVESLNWRGSDDQRDALCFGSGKDSHGSFISVGWMRPGNRITLARRYVSDERTGWSAKKVKEMILPQIQDPEDEETVTMPPWQCALMDA